MDSRRRSTQPRRPRETTTVNNLRDAFAWVEHMLAVCQRFWGDTIGEAIADKLATLTMSTCFSGVGNAENALDAITRGVQHFYGGPSTLPANRWACEWYDESRCELVMLTHAPEHLFADGHGLPYAEAPRDGEEVGTGYVRRGIGWSVPGRGGPPRFGRRALRQVW